MSRTVDPFVTNGAIRSAASHALLNGHSSPALHARPCVPPAERAASNLSLAMLLKRAQTASVSDCDAFDAVRSRMALVRVRAAKWPYREPPRNNINVCAFCSGFVCSHTLLCCLNPPWISVRKIEQATYLNFKFGSQHFCQKMR